MSYKEITNNELYQQILNLFSINFISMGKVSYGGNILIVFVEFDNVKSLTKQWKEFNSFISTKAFSNEQSDFSKWNFYVFFLAQENVNKDIKYNIENNKFSSRKIIVENCPTEIDTGLIELIIKEHITNENIIDTTKEDTANKIERNTTISNALNKFKSPTKKTEESDYFESVLGEIEKTIKDEI